MLKITYVASVSYFTAQIYPFHLWVCIVLVLYVLTALHIQDYFVYTCNII